MMNPLRYLVLVVALLLPVSLAAQTQDLAGRYAVTGENPQGQGRYSGMAEVVRTGETYQVAWEIAADVFIGTGIYQDGLFSVSYQIPGRTPGIVVYRVYPDGSLSGVWSILGQQALGTEAWKPQGR